MCADSPSALGRWDESLPRGPRYWHERGTLLGRGVRALLAVALVLLTGLPAPAIAQAPGPELFAQEPRTPMELWDAIEYLVSTEQAKKAVPYLDRFSRSQPDDATWVQIRERFGIGSVLRLADDPATAPYAKPLADRLAEASRRFATEPERLKKAVTALTGTRNEQNYGVARLREAGPYAIPVLVETLRSPETSAEERALLVRNMGRLESSVVPALLAVMDGDDPRLQADAATAMGRIGDSRAVPFLTFPASSPDFAPEVREAAQAAIARLTGKPFEAQSVPPAQALADAAWKFHRRQVEFPGEKVAVWGWDKEAKNVAPRTVSRDEAETLFARRLADQALKLQPNDPSARAVAASIALREAVERAGTDDLQSKDQAAVDAAIAAGPDTMTTVLKTALADRDDRLAAAAASVLGKQTDRAGLSATGRPHALVEALWASGPRTPLAAAKAIVDLAPTEPFPGSSRLVPVLTRYIWTQRTPRAVVIDDNPSRGSQLAGAAREIGYEATMETQGYQGFRAAAETADVEIVFVSHTFGPSSWSVTDILSNLKSDSRTRNLPVYVYGPRDLEIRRPNLPLNFPGVKYVVQPLNGATLERLIGGRPARLSDADRGALAEEAAGLLAKIAAQPRSPFAEDLSVAEPALAAALSHADTGAVASTALGDIPDADAQRSLAGVVAEISRPIELRRNSAAQLTRSIQKFGPLVTANQEVLLTREARVETDPELRSTLQQVVNALQASAKSLRGKPSQTTTPGEERESPSAVDKP